MLAKENKKSMFEISLDANSNVLHYPTLKTVLMVEKVLQNAKKPLNKNEIKAGIKVKIMHQTLNIILAYFEERGLIVKSKEGYVWTCNPSRKLAKTIKEGRKV